MHSFRNPIPRCLGLVAAVLLLVACPDPDRQTDPNGEASRTVFRLDVVVESRGDDAETLRLDGASLALSRPGTGEVVGTVNPVEGQGLYQLHALFEEEPATVGELLLTVTAPGYAPQYRRVPPATLREEAVTPLLVSIVLEPMAPFEVANFLRLGMLDDRVTVSHPPEHVATGASRLFHPELDVLGFPGPMKDSLGRHLGSGVFSSVQLEDETGGSVSDLGGLATLRLNLPRDMWPSIVAIEPGDQFIEPGDQFIEPGDQFIEPGDQFRGAGSDPIQVPIYGFDTGTGSWSFASLGHLVGVDGAALALDDLASLWADEYASSVFVQAEVEHFSYWGYAWPRAGEGCVSGQLVFDDENPAPGVTLTATGVGHPFVSELVVSGDDGGFCIPTPPLREARGEGLRITAGLGDVLVDLGAFRLEAGDGAACGSGVCQDLGVHRLPEGMRGRSEQADDPATSDPNAREDVAFAAPPESAAANCEARFLTELNGNAAARVEVRARLPHASASVLTWCREHGCVLSGLSDDYGEVSLVFPHDEMVEISLYLEAEDGRERHHYTGTHRLDRCPDEAPYKLSLGERRDELLLEVYLDETDGRFAWAPQYPAYLIEVRTADGRIKWAAGGDGPDARFERIAYGERLDSAPTLYPRDGEPEALEAGDVVHVYLAATREHVSSGEGTLVIDAATADR